MVDLWGGVADADSGKLWEEDTVSIVFSCTKGATALCAHILSSRGQLDLDHLLDAGRLCTDAAFGSGDETVDRDADAGHPTAFSVAP